MAEWQEVWDFWFPEGLGASVERFGQQAMWWMRGGADGEIRRRFSELTDRAATGALDHWSRDPRGALALLLVLDQFSRSVYRGTPRAYAQDPAACALASAMLDNGDYARLAEPWQKMFVLIALGHKEGADLLARLDRAIALGDALVEDAPAHLRSAFQFSAQQPREHRKVLERFGRYPHRNAILGRESTADEQVYLAAGTFPHERDLPV